MARRTSTPPSPPSERSTPRWPFLLGVALLAWCSLLSLLLVLEHVGGLNLPGCREGGACEQAANSIFGSVPLGSFHWPVAYLGLAYFLAMLLSWFLARGVLPTLLRWIVRLGALVSLGYTALILVKSMLCPYCLGAHIGNFAFWMILERSPCSLKSYRPYFVRFAAFIAAVTLVLGIWDGQHRASLTAKAEAERSAAASRIIEQGRENAPAGENPSPAGQPATIPAPGSTAQAPKTAPTPASNEQASAQKPTPNAPAEAKAEKPRDRKLFIGRYRLGPDTAPLRLVIFMGYQCPDCYLIEKQLLGLLATRKDLAVSVKHFPFCHDCNPYIGHTSQANGCWAARAAEAAGVLWGADGFWKMHKFLFDIHGTFENLTALAPGFQDPGYSPEEFARTMTSDKTLQLVKADCAEAESLGLFFTPMIFVNGVELKGWNAPDALTRTVLQVAATNPPARPVGTDYPPVGLEKLVEDWRDEPVRSLPPETHAWTMGKKDASVRLVIWGDYQEAGSIGVDSLLQIYMKGHPDVSLTFRHYPFNKECSPKVPDNRFPNACRAALAAEAAAQLGGNDAYWKMHAWLMGRRGAFDDNALSAAAGSMGLDGAALLAAMQKPEVKAALTEDVRAADALPVLRIGVPPGLFSIPTVFLNERYVPRWIRAERNVLTTILDAAGRTK